MGKRLLGFELSSLPFALSFIVALLFALGVSAEAQTTAKMPRIARLSPSSAAADAPVLEAFRQGLRDHGWIEGQNIVMEYRFSDGKPDRLPQLAAELVRLKVDVILTGATVGALAAKQATNTIPIVVVTTGDPVASGLVSSLARPGGNLTGLTALGQELSGKRLQLLKEAVPGINRVAVLSNPTNPDSRFSVKDVETAAQTVGVQLQVHEVGDPNGFDGAFHAINQARADGLMVLTDAMFLTYRKRVVELSAKSRLPTMYPISEFTNAGGLMFYGASFPAMYRRAAVYVDKILKGAKPADLPVEQPTKFDFVINLKAAKQIGLTIPQWVLMRADKVIK
jgi:putative tryptophan/tyrosine transport system substrate-binding protein